MLWSCDLLEQSSEGVDPGISDLPKKQSFFIIDLGLFVSQSPCCVADL
jgi:hypothetical protein